MQWDFICFVGVMWFWGLTWEFAGVLEGIFLQMTDSELVAGPSRMVRAQREYPTLSDETGKDGAPSSCLGGAAEVTAVLEGVVAA